MRPTAEGVFAPRCALFESLEDRLVLSAHALADFFAQTSVSPIPALEVPTLEDVSSAETMADTLAQGGVTAARSAYGFKGAGQTVAIIDTGIAYDHYALGRGYGTGHRVVGGWDFAENDANPYDDGPAGFHGTHVAGIVGSSDSRYSGVAPDADLVALRVFDDQGNGNFAWVESALKWVHEHRNSFANPITTVNLSLGTNWNAHTVPNWAMLEDEFAQLKADGIFISVAAGNSFNSYRTPGLSYPAASSHVVPVASVGDSGLLSGFSQRSARVIAAPGERIMSAIPDFLFGGDGVPNDFMAASGTSMAAPYVAGASVLLRQAMQFAGHQNITEDALYSVMYNTADLVFDSVTNASYRRLNLERAIDSVMPADDYGSTTATAFSLGSIGGTRTIVGQIGRLDDRDFFTFTAGATGTMRFGATGTGALVAAWTTPTGSLASGNALSFDVLAGQSYSVGLGTSGGLGAYTIIATLEGAAGGGASGDGTTSGGGNSGGEASGGTSESGAAEVVDWGVVDFKQVASQNMASGDAWFKVTASRTGILTSEALFSHSGGNIDLELYSADKQLLRSSSTLTNDERLDFSATAGQVFYLRVKGVNANVDFRLTNLVTVAGTQVDVAGTAGNDVFSFAAGTGRHVTVNGVRYALASSIKMFNLNGGAGNDSIVMTGAAARETATMRLGETQLVATAYRATARGFENVVVVGNGGADVARLYDSAGNDTFTASPTSATLSGAGFSHTVQGFVNVSATATLGQDTATLFDSAGNDRFVGQAASSFMVGRGFYNLAVGFDSVTATASAGIDRAELYGTSGSDVFIRTAGHSQLRGATYSNTTVGFDSLRTYGGGGVDQAVFRDVGTGDYFYGRFNTARLSHAGIVEQVSGFRSVVAEAQAGNTPRSDVRAVSYIFERLGQWS